jgi:hypothetical protein
VPRLHECHRAALRLCRGPYPHATAAPPSDCFGGGGVGDYGDSGDSDAEDDAGGPSERAAARQERRQQQRRAAAVGLGSGSSSGSSSSSSGSSGGAGAAWSDRNLWLPPPLAGAPPKPRACVRKFERPKPHLEAATVAPLGPRRLRQHLATLVAREQPPEAATAVSPSYHHHHHGSVSSPGGSSSGSWSGGWPEVGAPGAGKRSGSAPSSPKAQKTHRRYAAE